MMVLDHSNKYYNDSFDILNSAKPYNIAIQDYPNIQDELNQTSSQRVRAAMFPETLNEGYAESLLVDASSAVQHLAKPSQMLKLAVIDLVNYQDDADAVMRAIPEIIPLLNDLDTTIVKKTALLLDQLSRKDACRRVMAESQQLVAAILQTIDTTNDLESLTYFMGALSRISKVPNGLLNIFRCRAIPLLVKLLGTSIEKVQCYAISTLHQLLLYQEGSKQEVNQCGGLQKMVSLLHKNDVKFLTVTADCIQMLAYGNQESKLILLASGAPLSLVAIMANQSYEKLLWMTSRVLKILSVCSSNKMAIIESEGIKVLSSLLHHQSNRLVQNCLWIIRNLSDCATNISDVNDLLEFCVHYLSVSDLDLVACSAGILSNLTCNNVDNKIAVCRLGGVESLVQCLLQLKDRIDIVEPTACALRHLTSRHPYADGARNAVRVHFGIPPTISLLYPPTYWPLMKASLGLVRNLALNEDNQAVLKELPTLQNIEQILLLAHQHIHTNNFDDDNGATSMIDGVSGNDMVEICVGAMHILARDSTNRQQIIAAQLIPLFVQLLYSESIGTQRVSSGVLCELSYEPHVCDLIEKEGAIATLTHHLHSNDEAVATYSAVVLYRMSEDKSEDYKQRLSIELTNSLARNISNNGQLPLRNDLNFDEPYRGYNGSFNDAYNTGLTNNKSGIAQGSYEGSSTEVGFLTSDRGANSSHDPQRTSNQIPMHHAPFNPHNNNYVVTPRSINFQNNNGHAHHNSWIDSDV